MKDAPAFDFYPERWLVGTASMSDIEQIVYLRLLCHQWIMDGLPAPMTSLRRLAGRAVTPSVLEKFPLGQDGKRRNARLETIRFEQRKRIAKRREGAALTNAKRHAQRHASDNGSDVDSASPPPTTHHPPHSGGEPPAPPRAAGAAGVAAGSGAVGDSTDPKRRSKPEPFTAPSLAEWVQYAGTLNPVFPPGPAEDGWDHYQKVGWTLKSGGSVKDWKATCRTSRARWIERRVARSDPNAIPRNDRTRSI